MPSSTKQQGGGNRHESASDITQRGEAGSPSGQGMRRYGRDLRGPPAEGRSPTPSAGGWLEPYGVHGNSPFSIMRRFTDEMDRLFESFGMGSLLSREGGRRSLPGAPFDAEASTWFPHIEMCEREGRLAIQADLPGLRNEDIDVRVEDDAVVLSGKREQETERNRDGVYVSERSYGSFHRVISLPEGADAENATATFRDGVLKIEMPYAQRRRGRTLQISDGGDDKASERSQWSSSHAGTSKSGGTAQQSSAWPAGGAGQQSATGAVQGEESSQRGGSKEASR